MTLLETALAVRENAHVPYSKFKVGAAVKSSRGGVFAGCNVENVSYPEGSCAETGAIAAMVAAGHTRIAEVVVVADGPQLVSPCGGCRQRLAEFAGPDTPVLLAAPDGREHLTSIGALLPGAFGPGHLEGAR